MKIEKIINLVISLWHSTKFSDFTLKLTYAIIEKNWPFKLTKKLNPSSIKAIFLRCDPLLNTLLARVSQIRCQC